MRLSFPFLLLAFSFFGFSQEEQNSIYFPQEQLTHPDCVDAEDKNTCLKNNNELSRCKHTRYQIPKKIPNSKKGKIRCKHRGIQPFKINIDFDASVGAF